LRSSKCSPLTCEPISDTQTRLSPPFTTAVAQLSNGASFDNCFFHSSLRFFRPTAFFPTMNKTPHCPPKTFQSSVSLIFTVFFKPARTSSTFVPHFPHPTRFQLPFEELTLLPLLTLRPSSWAHFLITFASRRPPR